MFSQPFTIVRRGFTVMATSTLATCANNKTGSVIVVATGLVLFNIELTSTTSTIVLYSYWDVVTGGTFTGIPAGEYTVIVTHIESGCVVNVNVTIVKESCHRLCARSHGYWKNHFPNPCPSAVCAPFCGLSPRSLLTSPASSGDAVIISGRQFTAFVFNHYFFNLQINLRTLFVGAPCPSDFDCELWAAYLFLNTMSRDGRCATTPRAAIINATSLIGRYNSGNDECRASGGASKGKSKSTSKGNSKKHKKKTMQFTQSA